MTDTDNSNFRALNNLTAGLTVLLDMALLDNADAATAYNPESGSLVITGIAHSVPKGLDRQLAAIGWLRGPDDSFRYILPTGS